ncbi:glycosyltransferase [Albibacterium indicum]|uniref:glycosyltransferase n=1 Tax=Albibacterium indicum TaxID=2292082 RepID=UPI000E54507E|nr:glycosyltransferase [Pedobacter indicus]
MIKVLHIVTRIDEGGISSFLSNYYQNIDPEKVRFEIVAIQTEYKQGYHDRFNTLGVAVHYMPEDLRQRVFYLYRLIKSGKYDIVHSHVELVSSIYLIIAALAGVTTRVAHTHLAVDIKEGFKNRLLRFFLNRVSTLKLGASKKAIQGLYGKKYKQQAIVLYNAIDVAAYSYDENIRTGCRKELNLDDKFIVGFVGRLTYLKNIEYVIDVFNALEKMPKDAVLLIVGSGELKDQLTKRVDTLGINHKVFFLGSRFDINRLMMAMDILLLPSFNEGLGMVLIEAQAAALKCITSLNRVPEETNISSYIHYRDIDESPHLWAEFIKEECFSYTRKPIDSQVRSHRFDVRSEARELVTLYERAIANSN